MIDRLEPEFVEFIPEQLATGTLYVSMEYATASHLCCCGCGEKVVTPFTPIDWRMTFDGETVSLRPSVGNWEQQCQSHYVIDRNRVVEHGPWTRTQVARERARDRDAKARYFNPPAPVVPEPTPVSSPIPATRPKGLWAEVRRWISGR